MDDDVENRGNEESEDGVVAAAALAVVGVLAVSSPTLSFRLNCSSLALPSPLSTSAGACCCTFQSMTIAPSSPISNSVRTFPPSRCCCCCCSFSVAIPRFRKTPLSPSRRSLTLSFHSLRKSQKFTDINKPRLIQIQSLESARSAASSPRATPRPEPSSRPGSISGQPPSAINSDPFMPTGSSRPASTRTTSPLLCSPRSREGFYSPRCNGVPVRSKLRSIPSSPLPSADEPKPDSFTATAEVGSRLLDKSSCVSTMRLLTRCH